MVNDGRKWTKPLRVRKVKEDDVACGKRAQPGQCRQTAPGSFGSSLSRAVRSRDGRGLRRVIGCCQQGRVFRRAQLVTSEPIRSPSITRRMFPVWFMLKMIMGMLLSLQRLTAVISITFNPSRMISM